MNMLHWLHSLWPHIPHYGYVLVFVVVFLNNIGFPLPGETILLWGPDLFWGEPRIRCGNPRRPERRPHSSAAFVPFGWVGDWVMRI